MRYLLTANFNVEANSEDEAEALFDDYLEQTTVLTDTKSIAFECIESVMHDDDDNEYAISQADGYASDGPDAMLREDAA